MQGYVHSIQSLGTVDGPGVRAVVFSSGCPLRCIYCHNPDTHRLDSGELTESSEVAEKIKRLIPYIKNGGVTFSGGEPCMQAVFFKDLAQKLKCFGLHIALDTSGCILNDEVKGLLDLTDLVLLDIKFTSNDDYKRYTGGTLDDTLSFLEYCESRNIPVFIRHVVVPKINDTKEDILKLKSLTSPYKCINRIELLPFKKLCLEKYEMLGLEFKLRDVPELSADKFDELTSYLDSL